MLPSRMFFNNLFDNMKEYDNVLKCDVLDNDDNYIFEFDTLDELRVSDESYVKNTRSPILKTLAKELKCSEDELLDINAFKHINNAAAGFRFNVR